MEDNKMKNYTITVNGTPYNVTVEDLPSPRRSRR